MPHCITALLPRTGGERVKGSCLKTSKKAIVANQRKLSNLSRETGLYNPLFYFNRKIIEPMDRELQWPLEVYLTRQLE